MKTWSIITYIVGSLILLISFFTQGVVMTWCLCIFSMIMLSGGCFLQIRSKEMEARKHLVCAKVPLNR